MRDRQTLMMNLDRPHYVLFFTHQINSANKNTFSLYPTNSSIVVLLLKIHDRVRSRQGGVASPEGTALTVFYMSESSSGQPFISYKECHFSTGIEAKVVH